MTPAPSHEPLDAGHAPRKGRLARFMARYDDGELVRCAFIGLLVGGVGVLALDFMELARENGWSAREVFARPLGSEPILPPVVHTDGPVGPRRPDPRGGLTADEDMLRQPVRFRLMGDGVLAMEGNIDQGSSDRLESELSERGEYVRVVTLNSSGGSLQDALAMARLIRERGLDTRVEDGALCASSCPLIFAGGENRSAGELSAIGLHQFYAAPGGALPSPEQAMADAQSTTARISRHLLEMGVDPSLWLHALETPPRALYYLTAEEMERYRLVSQASPVAAGGASPRG
jgi:hypothetical protein